MGEPGPVGPGISLCCCCCRGGGAYSGSYSLIRYKYFVAAEPSGEDALYSMKLLVFDGLIPFSCTEHAVTIEYGDLADDVFIV